jgi:hypothetical protein
VREREPGVDEKENDMDKLMALITVLLLALSFDAAGAREVTQAGEAPTVRAAALTEGDIQAPSQSDDIQAPRCDV